ncbi:MAG: peptidylprolyl isomerase [Planctomycetia bacterium]|nr:peptidylprolyl isomerase [Planctomycetia bacterium]
MKTLNANKMLRPRFEQLEDRLVLSAAPTIANLPDSITLYQGESYHYAADDLSSVAIDASTTATVASLPGGRQVTIEYAVQDDSGATTPLGTIVLQLFEEDSPLSTERFLTLVESGYYDGTGDANGTGNTVHRIIDGFMFQGGSRDGFGYQGSTLPNIDFEYSPLLTHASQGVVAMANSGWGSGTSNAQFYITDAACSWLDGGYNIVGFVVSGYETIEAITAKQTQTVTSPYNTSVANYPVDKIIMTSVTVTETPCNGVLRLAATDATAVGTSTLVLSVTDGQGYASQKTVTVNVLPRKELTFPMNPDDPMAIYVEAGDAVKIDLPEYYQGTSAIQYTVTGYDSFPDDASEPTWDLDGLTWQVSGRSLTVTADATVAQRAVLKISVAALNQSTGTYTTAETYYLDVFVTPGAPEMAAKDGDTPLDATTATDGNFEIVIDHVNEKTDLYLTAACGGTTSEKMILRKDGSDTTDNSFVVESTKLATGLYRTVVTVTREALKGTLPGLGGEDLNGTWTLKVWQEVPLSKVSTDYENLVSEEAAISILVAEEMPEFLVRYGTQDGEVVGPTAIDVTEGTQGQFSICVQNIMDGTVAASDFSWRVRVINTSTETVLQEGAWADFATSGVASWTFSPQDTESPYTFRCEVSLRRKADEVTSMQTFLVNVPEVNVPPQITFVPDENYAVDVESSYSWKITFTDDLPAQTLTWSLSGTVPDGMSIDSTVQTDTDGSHYCLLSWTPAREEADQNFAVTVTVADPDSETDSVDLNFTVGAAPVDPDPADDDLVVDEPAAIPTIVNWQDYRSVWNGLVQQRLSALAGSLAKFVNAYSQAGVTHSSDLTNAQAEYAKGNLTDSELAETVQTATQTRRETQQKSLENLVARAKIINTNSTNRANELNAAATDLGIPTTNANEILSSRPLGMTLSQMKTVWQYGFSLNSRFLTRMALAPQAVDCLVTGSLADLL